MWTAAVLLLCATLANAKSLKATPEPDNSELCTTCTKTIDDLQLKWTNATTVAEILAQLDEKCDDKYNLKKKQICESIAAVLVQIPPGIFEGINSLAWPVSLGLCATFNQCTTNCCVANAKPEQVHLSLAGTDRSLMGVSWVTLTGDVSQVRYGTDPSQLTTVNTGTSLTYTQAGWIGMIHRAVMTNLQPSTKYYYQVGADDGASGWSDTFSFTTFTPGKEINYAVIADMAYDENSDDTVAALIDLVEAGQLDVVIHSGDISYADGYMPHFDDFMNKVQPIAARVPYQVSPGNHEFGYNFTAYKTRFFMPGQIDEGGSGDGMYYSWKYGHIHFTSMNSESPIDTALFTDRELEWVESDMSGVDRADTPWLIAHFHRPLYCARDLECGKFLMKLGGEDILVRNKVDLVFTAHEHTYERTNQVYNFTTTAGAPVYMLQGASGNREGNNGNYPPLSELPEWVASVHNDIGYGILSESADGSTLKWSFYKSKGMEQLDTVTFTKN